MSFDKIIEKTKPLKVLFVEDNDTARETISRLLKRFFVNLETASNGREGLEKFKEKKYDLVITDINMPYMNGIEMLKEIKKLHEDVYSIVVTAFNETEYFLEAIKLRVDGFILKPIDLDQIISVLQKVINDYLNKRNAKKYYSLLKQYQDVVDKSSLVCKIDKNLNITYANKAILTILGYEYFELQNKKFNEFFYDVDFSSLNKENVFKGILKVFTKKGEIKYLNSIIKAFYENDELKEYIMLAYDIDDMVKPRRLLLDYISTHQNPIIAEIYIENFENLRSLFGEEFTERLEKKFEEILKNKMPPCFKKIFYLDNGEFAIAGEINETPFEVIVEKLKEYQKSINSSTITINDFDYDISILISVATGKDGYENARLGIKKLLRERRSFIVANNLKEEIKKISKKNLDVLHLIKEALDKNLFVCVFQPIVNNKTLLTEKYETLVRINKNGKFIPPSEFLDLAKKGSFYSKITYQVLNISFEKLKRLDGISINISEIDIARASIRNYIYDLLQKYPDIAKRITFELLEDASSDNCDELEEFIKKIKSLGVKIAIDDFGTGYSNFIRLKKYQPDFLKIDGTLIKDLPNDSFSQSIVKAIVNFAKANNIKTIAEFVESKEIFDKVCELGIDYSQGYYFSKPILM